METVIASTPPATEPIDTADARAHLRLVGDDEDATIARLVAAARGVAERRGAATTTTGFTWTLDRFPPGDRPLRVPRRPLVSVESIDYTDPAGDPQSIDPEALRVGPYGIAPAAGECWPCVADGPGAVSIEFTAGYGDEAADVPAELIDALLIIVGHRYEHRGDSAEALAVPVAALGLIDLVSK